MENRTDGVLLCADGNAGRLIAVLAAALLAFAALAATTLPAGASPTEPGSVRSGKNVTVFHDADFIAAFGHKLDERLTVDVYRGEHRIATASGPAVGTEEGSGLEVNHGPAGAAAPGDCWEGVTPDILPGDRVVVTDSAGATDSVFVDQVSIDPAGPVDTNPADPFAPVVLEGRASYADGTPIPVNRLDSGELRQDAVRLRAAPTSVEKIEGTTDGWRATYQYPYALSKPSSLSPQQQKNAILSGTHAMGFGHTELPSSETQIAEYPAGGGPALDCGNPASPFYAPKSANAVATADAAVNLASGDLALGGTAAQDITSVSITLSDGDPATPDPTADATGLTAGPGDKGWSAAFPRAQVEDLNDGTLTATGAYTRADGSTTTGVAKKIRKDTAAPDVPTATPGAGLYNGAQAVTLGAEEGAEIRYTTDGQDPTAATGQIFGDQIQVPSSRTIRARAFDEAGNPSAVATFDYEIDTAAPTVSASPPGGLFKEARSVSLGSDDAGARIFYTTDNSFPTRSSVEFTGEAITVDRSKTIRTLAVDRAGNEARQSFVYTIDTIAPTVGVSLPAGSYDPGPVREVSLKASEDADIYFTTDGSVPSPGSPSTIRGKGPIQIDQTRTVRAVAVDRAGNTGAVASFGYVIRQPTRVSLRVATTNLKLGRTRVISGSVSPVDAGRSVRMTVYTPGTARNVTRTLALDGASRYSFAYRPKAPGKYSVSVSFVKDADHLGSISPLASFRAVR